MRGQAADQPLHRTKGVKHGALTIWHAQRRLATSLKGEVSMAEHQGLPVEGYRPQNETNVSLVNRNKIHEEEVLRVLDALAENPEVDKRWLAIGRTAIENGFMAVNRSIFKPGRVKLP